MIFRILRDFMADFFFFLLSSFFLFSSFRKKGTVPVSQQERENNEAILFYHILTGVWGGGGGLPQTIDPLGVYRKLYTHSYLTQYPTYPLSIHLHLSSNLDRRQVRDSSIL